MNKQGVLKGKIAIIKFMGFIPISEIDLWLRIHSNKDVEKLVVYDKALHDSSWDCLMPVVEKIESLLPEATIIQLWHNMCVIPMIEHGFSIECEAETKILACFGAVVDYIKWYNENKKTND